MTPYISFLLTLHCEEDDSLVRVALKIFKEDLKNDCCEAPMEPENRIQLFERLPSYLRTIGKIVNVEEITDVVV